MTVEERKRAALDRALQPDIVRAICEKYAETHAGNNFAQAVADSLLVVATEFEKYLNSREAR